MTHSVTEMMDAAVPAESERPLSIMQIVTCRGWSSDAWAAVALSLGLSGEGHRVLFLCRNVERGRTLAERIRREGVPEVAFIEASNSFHPLSYLQDLMYLRRLARERSVDIIHLHRGVEHWLAALAWPFGGAPSIVRSRHILEPVKNHLFNRWLYLRGTDSVIPVCEKILLGYQRLGPFPLEKFSVVMGGVDSASYRPSDNGASFRTEWGIPPQAWVVGVAGSLRMWMKGQDILLRAAARLGHEGKEPPWMVFIGKGEDLDNLKALSSALGLGDRAVFPGYVEKLAAAFAACDVLAFPSRRSEGTSRVLFEYLAAGRPVVASRVGCVEEIVRDGMEGILVPADDEAALAGALASLKEEPQAARKMGELARRRAKEEFDRRVMARRTVEIYRETVRSRRGLAQ